jgi:hypothetical protein
MPCWPTGLPSSRYPCSLRGPSRWHDSPPRGLPSERPPQAIKPACAARGRPWIRVGIGGVRLPYAPGMFRESPLPPCLLPFCGHSRVPSPRMRMKYALSSPEEATGDMCALLEKGTCVACKHVTCVVLVLVSYERPVRWPRARAQVVHLRKTVPRRPPPEPPRRRWQH